MWGKRRRGEEEDKIYYLLIETVDKRIITHWFNQRDEKINIILSLEGASRKIDDIKGTKETILPCFISNFLGSGV